ncbi:MAG: hypothetical protein PUB42_07430 [Firmicutes bacterium]|nr:hypothetical protein [Bacillota bacterium]
MKGISKIIEKKFGDLIFSLICGMVYFIIALYFILNHTNTGGGFLALSFSPAIICGMALVILKTIRRLRDEEAFGKINMLIYAHILLSLVSIILLLGIIF